MYFKYVATRVTSAGVDWLTSRTRTWPSQYDGPPVDFHFEVLSTRRLPDSWISRASNCIWERWLIGPNISAKHTKNNIRELRHLIIHSCSASNLYGDPSTGSKLRLKRNDPQQIYFSTLRSLRASTLRQSELTFSSQCMPGHLWNWQFGPLLEFKNLEKS